MGQACDVITGRFLRAAITSLECAGGWRAGWREPRDKAVRQAEQIVTYLLCFNPTLINHECAQRTHRLRMTHQ